MNEFLRLHQLREKDRGSKRCKPLAHPPKVCHVEPVAEGSHGTEMIATHDSTHQAAHHTCECQHGCA